MAGEVITVRAGQQPPRYWDASVFIDGFTPGPGSPPNSWRSEVITLFRERWTNAGRLVLFVAEDDGRSGTVTADERVGWHEHALGIADVSMSWWPDGRMAGTNSR